VGRPKILDSSTPAFRKRVHQEVHYDGLRWMSVYGKKGDWKESVIRSLKGEKLILWSAIAAGNYIYLIEYDFTDDGRIVSRLGFTAHNFYDRADLGRKGRFRTKEDDVHPHIGCWRMEFDLSNPATKEGGPSENDLLLVNRVWDRREGRFRVEAVPFPGDGVTKEAREGKAQWIAREFTTVRAQSRKVTNGRGQPVAYDLVSTRTGTTDGLLPVGDAVKTNMDFINYDFWATRTPAGYKHYHQVGEIAANQLPLKGERTTLWHSVAGLHVPRDEDFGPGGVDSTKGVALTTWVEFTLRPRNLFDGTPFYSPVTE
jgi:Cu2+-containing amine oxidase